ncbi:MAG: uracil-DNA glycosylase [bacterium]
MLTETTEIINQLRGYLRYYQRLGIESLPLKSEFLKDNEYYLAQLQREVVNCNKCKRCEGREGIIFGEGNPRARLFFVCDLPDGTREFENEADKLLGKIIEAIGLSRKDVYITYIVKCRYPSKDFSSNPLTESINNSTQPSLSGEIDTCKPFLVRQVEIIRPPIICVMGELAAQTLLVTNSPITNIRGKFYDFHGSMLMPTFSPAHLLKNPTHKRLTWEDVQMVQRELILATGRK